MTASRRSPSAGEPLSAREVEVLELMARGLSNGAIAGRLVLAEPTVQTHVSRVLRKLGAATRTEAVSVGHRSGLLRERSALPAPPQVMVPAAAWDAVLAALESVVAGRPAVAVRREALVALTAAGRRGPGGRPLAPVPQQAPGSPVAPSGPRSPSSASASGSVALRRPAGGIPSRAEASR